MYILFFSDKTKTINQHPTTKQNRVRRARTTSLECGTPYGLDNPEGNRPKNVSVCLCAYLF